MITAFVGHSFSNADEPTNRIFLDYFDDLKTSLAGGFDWDHAVKAEAKEIANKVREKMIGKNTFIGICCRKEIVVDPSDLKKSLFSNRYKILKNKIQWKTSEWIIQEASFAFGQGKNIILLVEDGVRYPDIFSTNFEYISFDRNVPSASLPRIQQMLSSLIKKEPNLLNDFKSLSLEKEPIQKEVENTSHLFIDDSDKRFEDRILLDLALNKSKSNLKILSDIRQNDQIDDQEKARLEALDLYLKWRINRENTLQDILQILSLYENNPFINYYVGEIYHGYNNLKYAKKYFEMAYKNSAGHELEVECSSKFVLSLFETEDPSANDYLNKLLFIKLLNANELKNFWEALITIFKFKDDKLSLIIAMESILQIDPTDNDIRFELAMNYSNLKEDGLALMHYLILSDMAINRNDVLNNIGVSCDELGLHIQAEDAYDKSANLGNSLAVRNIAMKLVNIGLVNKAKHMCDPLLKDLDINSSISEVYTNIDEFKKHELVKQKSILEAARIKQNFLQQFSQSLIAPPFEIGILSGEWESNSYILDITNRNNKIIIKRSFKNNQSSNIFNSLLSKVNNNKITIYICEARGLTFDYTKSVKSSGDFMYDPSSPGIRGWAIVEDSFEKIVICDLNSNRPEICIKISKKAI